MLAISARRPARKTGWSSAIRTRTAVKGSVGSRTVNDIVVFGATGFVGRLVAGYLAGHAPPELQIALAGRSRAKLERTREELGRAAADWPLVVADSDDPASLTAMARRRAGRRHHRRPVPRDGIELVDACIAAGAHYCDLTGEILFAHESLERHERGGGRRACGSSTAAASTRSPPTSACFLLHEAGRRSSATRRSSSPRSRAASAAARWPR